MFWQFHNKRLTLTSSAAVVWWIAGKHEMKERYKDMKKIKITAANKKHFDSLIRDFRNNGFMLVTYGRRLAELETETEFVIIEF